MTDISIEQWNNHPTFRQDLSALIENPVFQIALGICRQTGNRPSNISALPPGVTLVDWFAMMGAKREGYFEGISNLVALTKTVPSGRKEPRPWEPAPKPPADKTS